MKVFLGILLFFILFWYALKLFVRYVLPWLIQRFVKKQQARYEDFQRSAGGNQQDEVHIKKGTSKKAKDDKDFGEYVDFEDIEE